jgi:two-component system CheB/CheR fusion protein
MRTGRAVSNPLRGPGMAGDDDGSTGGPAVYAAPVIDKDDCVLVLCVETGPASSPPVLLDMLAVVAQTVGQLVRRTRAEAELRAGVTRRDQFLAMLSHELRNPLAAVRNATLALQRPDAAEPQRLNATSVIVRQVQHMSHLLDDLLDVARLTQDRLTLQRGPLVVGTAVTAAVEMVQPMAQERGVELSIAGDGHELVIDGDATRISQMLANLLTNGVKYSPPGARVVVSAARDGGHAVLRVRDQGAGMSHDVLTRIFDLFYQADETIDRRTSGMGVGLTLARRLAEMHGGTLEAFSAGPARGSEFVARLPLEAAREVSASQTHGTPASCAREVIVIEDHDDNREMTRMLLAFDGHRVHTAKDGIEGVSLIERLRPDVALIDIGLPGLDGYSVARQIRRKPELGAVALIALSGYAQPADVERALDAGFDEHVAKPVTFERLCAVVQAVCDRRTAGARGVAGGR